MNTYKNSGICLSLWLITSCSLLPLPSSHAAAALELYGTFAAMGITVELAATDDPNQNARANVEYRQGNGSYRPGFPLSRVSPTRFVGSLFWLEPGTNYAVRVTFTDPNQDPLNGVVLSATAATRPEITVPTPNNTFIVSATGAGTACTLAAPCALTEGILRAQPGDAVLLRGGIYYQGEIVLPRSGARDAPIVIRGYGAEEAVVDGADPTPLTWTAIGAGVYHTTLNRPEINLITANGERIYPYPDLAALQNLSWNLPGYYAAGQDLYIHLTTGADPNQATLVIARYNRGFEVEQDYIYFLNLTLRHFGQGSEARAIYFKDASNNLVQDSVFAINNGGIAIKDASHRNVIQGNEFYDTIFAWPWDAVKATGLLERGGIYASGSISARGNVIRRNTFHDYFDGFDVCPSEPLPGQPANPTHETDVYDNLVYNMGDDGVQVDGWCSNVRLWNNTFHDVLVGMSFAPLVDGPVYALRNLIYRFGVGNNDHAGRSFKFNNESGYKSGPIYLLHNTADAVTAEPLGLNLSSGSTGGWALVYARNNIWASPNLALRNENPEQPVDLDYNNLWSGGSANLVRWSDTKYPTLVSFTAATGQESHGRNVDPAFVNVQTGNYLLSPLSPLIDAGVVLPGINDNYIGAAPDIGAIESAAALNRQIYLPYLFKR